MKGTCVSQNKKIRVFGWSADNAGCQSWRIAWPSKAINSADVNVEYRYGTVMSPEDMEWCDVVIGQRVAAPASSHWWQKWGKNGTKKLIAEFDDDLWNIDPENTKAYEVFNDPKIRERVLNNIGVADAVTVSTEPLRQMVNQVSGFPLDRIHVIPNAVPTWLTTFERERNVPLGWMGSPTHHGDFAIVQRHLKRLMEADAELVMHTIGSDYGAWMKLPQKQLKHTSWITSPEDAVRAIDYTTGIIPLKPTVFNRSKSSCKWLELAALGIPAAVSDVTAYQEARDSGAAVMVKYEHEWNKKIRSLVYDEDMRAELGSKAREYVRNGRTTEHTAPMWVDVIRNVT